MNATIERLEFRKYVSLGFNIYEARTDKYVIRIHRNMVYEKGFYAWRMKAYLPHASYDWATGEEIDLGNSGYANTKRELVARAQRLVADLAEVTA